MTDTAIIRLDLGIPAGQETCMECLFDIAAYACLAFPGTRRTDAPDGEWLRCPQCLAAEHNISINAQLKRALENVETLYLQGFGRGDVTEVLRIIRSALHNRDDDVRLPAAEERFTATPPTKPGYYKAHDIEDRTWRIVKVAKPTEPDEYLINEPLVASLFGTNMEFRLGYFDLWSAEPIAMPGGRK